jgi:DNA-binding IclR family transcriptional regulator
MRKLERLQSPRTQAGDARPSPSVSRSPEPVDRQFVTALGRGLAILRCFNEGERRYLANQDLAAATALPRPTVSRLTYTLTRLGYLQYARSLGRYCLGPAMLPVARAYMASLDVPAVARPRMQALAGDLECTVTLGARERLSMVFLEVCQGGGLMGMRVEVGAKVPHGATAMGRAHLCAASEAERRELLELYRRAAGAAWPAIRDSVRQSLRQYERHGFCFLMGETYTDVWGVGVPLVSPLDGRIFAFNCGGSLHGMTRRKILNHVAPRLVALRDAVLQQLQGPQVG